MPEETPEFSSKQIETPPEELATESKKEKTAKTKKTAAKTKGSEIKTKTNAKSGAKKAAFRKRFSNNPESEEEINKTLTAIYQDEGGNVPNLEEMEIKKTHSATKILVGVIIVGAIFSAIAWAGFFLLPSSGGFSKDEILLTISGPETATLGATTTYKITLHNKQRQNLNDSILTINYPEGFVFNKSDRPPTSGNNQWSLGVLGGGDKQTIEITGNLFGSTGEPQSWRAFLNFEPANFKSEMQQVTALTTVIESSPIELTISGPDRAAIGAAVSYTYKITWKNLESRPEALNLSPILPTFFSISTSTPELKKGHWGVEWKNDDGVGSSQEFEIAGSFNDTPSSTANLGANVFTANSAGAGNYLLTTNNLQTELVKNQLDLKVAINGTLSDFDSTPGDFLNITLRLKNNSKVAANNVSVSLYLDAPSLPGKKSIIDWAEIEDTADGSIQGSQLTDSLRRGHIAWSKQEIKDLTTIEPDEEVVIDLRLPLKNGESFDIAELKEYTIFVRSEASFTEESKTGTIAGNPIEITLNSDFKFENRIKKDNNNFDITWVLSNTFHPLKNIKLTATLFGDVNFVQDQNAVPAGEVKYDASAKELTWTINEMPLTLDVLAWPFTVTLNTQNPTQNTLVSKVRITAIDSTTGKEINFMGEEISLIDE